MSLTAEEIARRESEVMCDPETVKVRVRVERIGQLVVPDARGSLEEQAIFKVFTFEDNHILERATRYEQPVGDRGDTASATEPNEFRRLMVKRNLLDWSLDLPIERENGWMTPECYEKVSRVAAPLVDAFLREFETKSWVTEEDERLINRQSAILFSESSRGVADACEAVSLFCTLGNYWEKFGLNKDNLRQIPHREYLLLKLMIGREADAIRAKTSPRKQPVTRIAGAGGRTRPSMAKRIPL